MRIRLIADEGELWTNGEIYGTDIYLAEGMDDKDFYTITKEEYEEILKEEEELMLMIGG